MTFKQMYQKIQQLKGTHRNNLQVYIDGSQANVLNDDDLSIKNICFDCEDETVAIFACPTPGYANYDYPERIASFDETIDILSLAVRNTILAALEE